MVQHCYQSRYYGVPMPCHLLGELSALGLFLGIGFLHCFLSVWVFFSCGKLVFPIEANPKAHRQFTPRNPSSAQEAGISKASPSSWLWFNQGLREEETSPAVCSAPKPLNSSVAEMSLSSQGWSSWAGLHRDITGDTTGDITGALHTCKGSPCRPAHLRENWYPHV